MRIIHGKKHGNRLPDGVVKKCNHCGKAIFVQETEENGYLCPMCGGYFRMPARQRLTLLADTDSFQSLDRTAQTKRLGDFPGYGAKHRALTRELDVDEAVITGLCTIQGQPAAIAVCDSRFFMASLGRIFGDRIVHLARTAKEKCLPLVIVSCSGGARMQEGIHSLMQMARTSAAIEDFKAAGGLYISVLTEPTYGGVTASFAMQGDIILAEKHAMVGFAGPRVIAQTVGRKLPKDFQSAAFLQERGQIDGIVSRQEMPKRLGELLRLHRREKQEEGEPSPAAAQEVEAPPLGETLTPWERVMLCRKRERPVFSDYVRHIFPDFIAMGGDRRTGDDPALIGGIATVNGYPVTVLGQEKGHTTKEQIARNFGMPSPAGYEKARRLLHQAQKFHRPVICFVDTPGAACGIEAEEGGQGGAIARLLADMMASRVPVLSILIGEGGSGGALALACANEVWALENATYSILSPEGFASILWKDAKRAKEAARLMGLTADELMREGVIDKVIKEPAVFTADTLGETAEILRGNIWDFMVRYSHIDEGKMAHMRYNRFDVL